MSDKSKEDFSERIQKILLQHDIVAKVEMFDDHYEVWPRDELTTDELEELIELMDKAGRFE